MRSGLFAVDVLRIRLASALAHGITFHLDSVCVMDKSVEDTVREGGIYTIDRTMARKRTSAWSAAMG